MTSHARQPLPCQTLTIPLGSSQAWSAFPFGGDSSAQSPPPPPATASWWADTPPLTHTVTRTPQSNSQFFLTSVSLECAAPSDLSCSNPEEAPQPCLSGQPHLALQTYARAHTHTSAPCFPRGLPLAPSPVAWRPRSSPPPPPTRAPRHPPGESGTAVTCSPCSEEHDHQTLPTHCELLQPMQSQKGSIHGSPKWTDSTVYGGIRDR